MPGPRMHADELEIGVQLVRRLVDAQFPQWSGELLRPVSDWGTDNALYRLGDELVVRLPRTPRTVETLEKERHWLPVLAPHLPLAVPVPVADGEPAESYPFPWSVYRWLDGEPATTAPLADLRQAAADLAGFVSALQAIDPAGGPVPGAHNFGRGVPLPTRDNATRTAIASLQRVLDARAVTTVWEEALAAPAWARPPVWLHGDLDARNVLVRDDRLSAVIDFGSVGIGDPACDVMVAWKLFPAEERADFRARLSVDEATWARARGWVVSQAVIALAYYTIETNPILVREARRWLAQALGDDR